MVDLVAKNEKIGISDSMVIKSNTRTSSFHQLKKKRKRSPYIRAKIGAPHPLKMTFFDIISTVVKSSLGELAS